MPTPTSSGRLAAIFVKGRLCVPLVNQHKSVDVVPTARLSYQVNQLDVLESHDQSVTVQDPSGGAATAGLVHRYESVAYILLDDLPRVLARVPDYFLQLGLCTPESCHECEFFLLRVVCFLPLAALIVTS